MIDIRYMKMRGDIWKAKAEEKRDEYAGSLQMMASV